MKEAQPKDLRLFELMGRAVEDGLSFVRRFESRGGYVAAHRPWPELSWFENGMPHLSKRTWDCPKDYASVLSPGLRGFLSGLLHKKKEEVFDPRSRPSFLALLDYVKSQQHLRARFVPDGVDVPERFTDSFVLSLPESAVDTYAHSYEEAPYSNEKFLPIYLPLEARILEDRLPVDVCVPILFVKFDTDEFWLDSGTLVARISDELHLARARIHPCSPSVHEAVLGAATHALVLKNYEVPNSDLVAVSELTTTPSAYPVDEIDGVFAAFRIVTGLDTGYAQLLLRPLGWSFGRERNLPPLEGTSVRNYPAWFEDYYWNKPVPTLTGSQLSKVAAIFARLMDTGDSPAARRLRAAARRLNRCYLREDEEDAVLDATIGLEILLSDGDAHEMTHKLALRAGAISTLAGGLGEHPVEVFRNVKRVYGFRSAIVHGDVARASKKREIKLEEKEAVPTVTAATKYLRMALKVLSEHAHLLTPSVIDETLLLKSEALSSVVPTGEGGGKGVSGGVDAPASGGNAAD